MNLLSAFRSSGKALPGVKSWAALWLLGITALMAGCGGGSSAPTVVNPTLTSIEVATASTTLVAGVTAQLSATGMYSDGSKQDLTATVTWTSATPAVASVSTAGVATGLTVGTSVITAASGSVSGTLTLTVTAPTLVSIDVTPTNPSIALGTTEQFTAMGVYTDSSKQNLTATVKWTSATATVATINAAGLATSAAVGSSVITATLGSVSGTSTLTVTAATLVSIGITPGSANLPLGTTQQFVATGTYSNHTTQTLTTSVTWASSSPAAATISNTAGTNGKATSVALGTTSITASLGGITSPGVTVTVSAATLVSIGVTPALPSIAKTATQQFVATGVYTDNSMKTLTTSVTWASSVTTVATISNVIGFDGLATGTGPGTTVITATLGSVVSPGVTLTVTGAPLVSIAVTPAAPSIAKGLTQQFVATGTYADSTTQVITNSVTWNSATPATATISNVTGTNGLATSVATGTTAITATLGTIVSPPQTLTVTAATLVSIAVTPLNPSIAKGLPEQFTAMGTYTDLTTQPITTSVTWHSATTATATISNATGTNGKATTLAVGTTAITASLGAVTSPVSTLTVTAATLVSIAVTPVNPTVFNQSTEHFTATGTYTDTTTQNITTTVAWTSGTPATATISNAAGTNGVATALALGTTSITAATGGITSPAQTMTVVAAEYLYATDFQNGYVLQYSIGNDGTLTAMATPHVPADGNPTGIAIDPTHHFLYVANNSTGDVSQFTIGATGGLTPMGTPTVTAGAGANSVTIDSSGTHAYVPNSAQSGTGAGTVSQYTIDPTTGALTPMTPASVTGTIGAAVLVINPAGTFAYVANYWNSTVSQFSISAGALTYVSDTALTAGSLPNSLVMDPTGTYLYVADEGGSGSIAQFSIDGTTGALTPLGTPYAAQVAHSITLEVVNSVPLVYVPNSNSGNLDRLQIGAGGDLVIPPAQTIASGATNPISIKFDPSGQFAYSADFNDGEISQFSVDQTTGQLSDLTPLTLPAGTNPAYMATTTQY